MSTAMAIPLTEEQEIEFMLARILYVQYSEHLGKQPKPVPYAPDWAYTYARSAIAYLGYKDGAIDALREDYR